MSEIITISMFEVVGGPFCVASSKGERVYERLRPALEADREVALSFRNVRALTFAFLNAAIGQLYGSFSEEKIGSLLKFEDADQGDLALLKRVVHNAKLYFEDPERFDRNVAEIHGYEDGDMKWKVYIGMGRKQAEFLHLEHAVMFLQGLGKGASLRLDAVSEVGRFEDVEGLSIDEGHDLMYKRYCKGEYVILIDDSVYNFL